MARKKLKFEKIADSLEARIYKNGFDGKDKLPNERDLAISYNCCRQTIRKALDVLQYKGLLETKPGSGNYLVKQKPNFSLDPPPIPEKETKLFGLIFQNSNPFYIFEEINNKIAKQLASLGFSIVYGGYISPDSPHFFKQVQLFIQRFIDLKVSGIFFTPFEHVRDRDKINHYIFTTLKQHKIPIILMDSEIVPYPHHSQTDFLSMDHINAGYVITDHLIHRGAQRILFIAPPDSANTIKLRCMGYYNALIDSNFFPNTHWYNEIDPKDTNLLSSLIRKRNPDAIICSNDTCAIEIYQSLSKLGISVPKQIMLTGFDNLNTKYSLPIQLSSIAQPVNSLVYEAIRMMFRRLENPKLPYISVKIPGRIVIRNSTKPV